MKKVLGSFLVLAFQFSLAQSTRNVGEFSSLKVYDKITVTLIHSDQNKVESSNSDVETVNKNGELKIRMAPTKILQGDQVSVKVFYENLNDIQASQGSSILSSENLESKMLSLTSNEGSKINLTVDAGKLNIKTNSGGEIKISGKADNQDIIVNSGGKYLGKNLDSKNATVTTNAGGIVEVNVSESVNATTRAGGVIDVYGDPNDRKMKNVIGGKINFK
ncbi:head GIN domain-containing protein [Kaistella sp.]|uniref:head GIN domain-containing protein n=1 Tax=Kaistella sp. TaxID=2782235 RepID=UPI003C5EB940